MNGTYATASNGQALGDSFLSLWGSQESDKMLSPAEISLAEPTVKNSVWKKSHLFPGLHLVQARFFVIVVAKFEGWLDNHL